MPMMKLKRLFSQQALGVTRLLPKLLTLIKTEPSKQSKTAKEKGVRRFIIVSSYGADNPENGPESLAHYLKAKQAADEELKRSGLDYTIVRPVGLSDDPATGKIAEVSGKPKTNIPRADVADFISEALSEKSSFYKTYTIESGDTPIKQFFN